MKAQLNSGGSLSVWRDSCYPPGHTTHSRRLTPDDIVSRISDIRHQGRFLSDHAPVTLQCRRGEKMPGILLWRLRSEALGDVGFREEVREIMEGHFNTNWNMTAHRCSEWNALKVVMRGECISKISGSRVSLEAELKSSEEDLARLQREDRTHGFNDTELLEMHRRVSEIWAGLDKLVRTEYRQCLHREGDRSGTMLAWLLKRERHDQ